MSALGTPFDDGAAEWGGRPVARCVASAGPRQRVVLAGTVTALRPHRGTVPSDREVPSVLRASSGTWLEADFDDGTGSLTLCWTGRTVIPGVAIGAPLAIWGTALRRHGGLVVVNPRYELLGPTT